MARDHWVHDGNVALLTDLYELTMLQSYFDCGMNGTAVFDLFSRRLPRRNYLLAAGLEDALHVLEAMRFSREAIDYLHGLRHFSAKFLEYLEGFRFTGDVRAVPEGTPLFPGEPILEVSAPMLEAQLVETVLLNQVHAQSLFATKAARVVRAARGRAVIDFGVRRTHGADAGLKAARAYYIAGLKATSNVLAGHLYGIPVAGTIAHSYVQAHEDELDAFRRFVRTYPETVLLIDTYDTLEGVAKVIELAGELGDDFRVQAVRLDSGDLLELSRETRRRLDQAGLERVQIFASSSLDEYAIDELLEHGAPIEAFGVGTKMATSEDAPSLDLVYKLVEYDGRGRLKLSSDKATLPWQKQIFRVRQGNTAVRDVLALHDESIDGEPLLQMAMEKGERRFAPSLDQARERAAREIDRLPAICHELDEADPPYRVELSPGLEAERGRLTKERT